MLRGIEALGPARPRTASDVPRGRAPAGAGQVGQDRTWQRPGETEPRRSVQRGACDQHAPILIKGANDDITSL